MRLGWKVFLPTSLVAVVVVAGWVVFSGRKMVELPHNPRAESVAAVDARAAAQCGGEAALLGERRAGSRVVRSYRCQGGRA
jgi:hypothetical protein